MTCYPLCHAMPWWCHSKTDPSHKGRGQGLGPGPEGILPAPHSASSPCPIGIANSHTCWKVIKGHRRGIVWLLSVCWLVYMVVICTLHSGGCLCYPRWHCTVLYCSHYSVLIERHLTKQTFLMLPPWLYNASLKLLFSISHHINSYGIWWHANTHWHDDVTLTHYLDSLGGNSKTIMVATIRTDMEYYQQTSVTLKYASRAKKVHKAPHISFLLSSLLISPHLFYFISWWCVLNWLRYLTAAVR